MASTPQLLTLGYDGIHPFSQVELHDRASLQQLLIALLNPVRPFFSPHKARIRLPGGTAARFDDVAAEVEGFCRPLWGVAALLAGEGGSKDGLNGLKWDGWRDWVQGLEAAVDPDAMKGRAWTAEEVSDALKGEVEGKVLTTDEFWGFPRDNDQRMVEMCPLGVTLAIAPVFWESLGPRAQVNLERWLGNSINEKNMPNTNWLWFRVFANLGLKKNGAKYSQNRLEKDIEHLETFYRGDGWSNDGPDHIHQMDYYSSSFAIQILQLLYSKLAGDSDPKRAAEFRKRAQQIALDLIHYYDAEGRAIPYGRSVIYRSAMVAFWGALALADVELPAPITWGVVKGILMRHLRWWQTQDRIWSSSGTLTIGYSYPNMFMSENYNSPGSPYWACLAFLPLAVPADHPFWTSKEEPLPLSSIPRIKALPHPKHITSYVGNHCMLLSSGQACSYPMRGTHAKYGGFAYSSAFAYSVPTGCFSLEQFSLASQLGFSDDGGETWKTRRTCEYAEIEERDGKPVLVSTWSPFAGVKVKTWLLPPDEGKGTDNWHLRAHKIAAGREVMTADGAFAIDSTRAKDGRALDEYSTDTYEGTRPRLIGNYDVNVPEGWATGRDGAFAVSKGAVGIRALEPDTKRTANLVNADPNSNLVEGRTVIPTLQNVIGRGETVSFVSAIYAKPSGPGVPKESYLDGWEKPPEVPAWLAAELGGT